MGPINNTTVIASLGALDYPNCGEWHAIMIGSDANFDSMVVPVALRVVD